MQCMLTILITDELKVLLTVKYVPMIVRWLATLQKNGSGQGLLSKLIDLKQLVQKSLNDLDMLTINRIGIEGTFHVNQCRYLAFRHCLHKKYVFEEKCV